MTNGSAESSTDKLTLGKESHVGPKYREVDESRMLEIMNRMNRVVMILKVVQNLISNSQLYLVYPKLVNMFFNTSMYIFNHSR